MRNTDLLDRLSITIRVEVSCRLDQAVLEGLRKLSEPAAQQLSRSALKSFFKEEQVLLHGKKAPASLTLEPGSHEVEILGWNQFHSTQTPLAASPDCFLPVLFEDENILVLHKFSGTPSVSLSSQENHSAASAALARFPELALIENAKPLEPGLLHRLDTGTSGILAFAKSESEFSRLRSAWKTAAVKKTYRALVESENVPTLQTIRTAIAHSSSSSKKMIVLSGTLRSEKNIRGKALDAVTHIRQFQKISANRFDLEIEIETGVMHQIRAHLASIGCPIVGDLIYGKTLTASLAPTPDQRLMLHAWRLQLPLEEGPLLRIQADLPANWH